MRSSTHVCGVRKKAVVPVREKEIAFSLLALSTSTHLGSGHSALAPDRARQFNVWVLIVDRNASSDLLVVYSDRHRPCPPSLERVARE